MYEVEKSKRKQVGCASRKLWLRLDTQTQNTFGDNFCHAWNKVVAEIRALALFVINEFI